MPMLGFIPSTIVPAPSPGGPPPPGSARPEARTIGLAGDPLGNLNQVVACRSGWPRTGLAIERDAVVSHEVCLSSDHIDDEERPRQHRKANMKRKNNLLRMKAHSSPQPLVCPTFRPT
jgi:hypothetical protein